MCKKRFTQEEIDFIVENLDQDPNVVAETIGRGYNSVSCAMWRIRNNKQSTP